MNNYYVYIYWRLDINEPFYVGKGKEKRWKELYRKNLHFKNIVNKYPIVVTIEKYNLTENEAFYWEEKIIQILVFEYGFSIDIPSNRSDDHYCHLVNKTWGGEGVSGHNSFENKTEEELNLIKKKISEGNKGKIISKETREKLRIASKNMSEEQKKKISQTLKGYKHTEETKKKMSKRRKGKNNPRAKSVICLTTKKIFFSAKEGAMYYKCDNSKILKCCKGYEIIKGRKYKVKSAGKSSDGTPLVWKYLIWNHNKKYRIIK